MATNVFYFVGEANYPNLVNPSPDYDKSKLSWKLQLKLDEQSKELFEKSELGLKVKDGTIQLRRPTKQVIKDKIVEWEPPRLVNADNTVRTNEVPSGSKVTVKVTVYDSRNGKGHRLEAVRVDEEGTGGSSEVYAADDMVPF